MGLITGQKDFRRWKKGEKLTRQESIDANCYVCNGGENEDCGGSKSCLLYKYSPFSQETLRKRAERAENPASREILATQEA